MRAAIHCDECAERMRLANPIGRIYLHRGHSPYHLALEDNSLATKTVCGLGTDQFASTIGTVGIELGARDLTHDWLRELDPCPRCFANVW